MNNDAIQALIRNRQLEEDLRSEFEATLKDRLDRYLAVKPHEIIPHTHFAPVSTELSLLFRDGHFYGCIALSQAVGEALIRFMCQRNGFKPSKTFEDNLEKLQKRGFLSSTLKSRLTELWSGRDDYHHLNPNIEQNRRKLQDLAKDKAHLLLEIEKEVFGFSINNGALVPSYPKYWDIDEQGRTQTYLRIK
jgi:hypothetical protein